MTNEEITAAYRDLLIIQYKKLVNARSTTEAFVKLAIADMLEFTVRDGFNIDTAVGRQLDIIGGLIGVSRRMADQITDKTFMVMPPYAGISGSDFGLWGYGDTPPRWFMYRYADFDGYIYILDDSTFRRLIKFAAMSQSMLFSLDNINNLLYTFFGENAILTDNGDMTLTYAFTDVDGIVDILSEAVEINELLPRPSGVGITVTHT